jgi:CheY-like chemotaxis protein
MSLQVPQRALLVEDEVLMAMLLEDMLGDLGYAIAARSTRLDEAVGLAATTDFDFSLLDINLNGERSFPVADVVRKRGRPFLFASGYSRKILIPPYLDAPMLHKPFSLGDLRRALTALGV